MVRRFSQRSEGSKDGPKLPNDKIVVHFALEELLYKPSTLEPHSLMSLTRKMMLAQTATSNRSKELSKGNI